jgi:hypothetical protein
MRAPTGARKQEKKRAHRVTGGLLKSFRKDVVGNGAPNLGA